MDRPCFASFKGVLLSSLDLSFDRPKLAFSGSCLQLLPVIMEAQILTGARGAICGDTIRKEKRGWKSKMKDKEEYHARIEC